MPSDLLVALSRLSEQSQQKAERNWQELPQLDQQRYLDYLDRAWLRRTRRERCRLLATQLLDPSWRQNYPIVPTGF
jgi:hypothetical protein